jgi:hypothetical protein
VNLCKIFNKTNKTTTETYNLIKVAFDDEALSQSTTVNGANISAVFEKCGKMSTALASHSCC